VPYVFSTPTLFYNANLFRQAGLDPDKPPATWAEVKQYGLQIKQRTAKLGIDIGCLGTFDWCFQALVLSNGGRVLSEDRARLTFAEQPSADAVAMWQDLVKSGIHPATTLSGTDGFSGGNVAMLLNTSALQSSLLAASSEPAVLHCTAGKDRTGVVVALLLRVLRVDAETIAADYSATEACLAGEFMVNFRRETEARGIDWQMYEKLLGCPPEFMLRLLEYVDLTYGGIHAYLLRAGLAQEQVEALQAGLVE
jgi:hypothetical protein